MSKIQPKIYITLIKIIKEIICPNKKMTKTEFSKQCNFNKNNNKYTISKSQNMTKMIKFDNFFSQFDKNFIIFLTFLIFFISKISKFLLNFIYLIIEHSIQLNYNLRNICMGIILNNEDINLIHQGSLKILENVGVRIDHNLVLERLADYGCIVDFKKNIAKISEDLVKKCLTKAPSYIKIGNRKWEVVELGDKKGSVLWSGNALYEVEDEKRYELTKDKFVQLIKVYDALDNVDGVVGVSLSDVPPVIRDIVGFGLMAEYTHKHLRPCIFSPDNVDAIRDIGEVLLNGRKYKEYPIYSLGYSICTPLHWTGQAMNVFIKSAGFGIPVTINSECLLGGSSPVTIAGGICLGNAEILSGIVINQIFEEGRPVIYNLGFSHVLDMRTSVALTGAPEVALIGSAGADLGKYYNLPSAGWISSDSLYADSQAGFEHMLLAMAFITSGVNIIWGMGQVEAQLSLSKVQAVIDNEIVSYIKRYFKGFKVNSETLAFELIKSIGISGEFLTLEHTLQNFKKELSFSDIVWRNRREMGEKHHEFSIEDRAKKYVAKIISRNETYISDNQKEEINLIIKSWLKRYGY